MENLRALVYGRKLNDYQKALAIKEFEKLESVDKKHQERIDELEKRIKDADVRWVATFNYGPKSSHIMTTKRKAKLMVGDHGSITRVALVELNPNE